MNRVSQASNAAVHYTSLSNAGVGLAEAVREILLLKQKVDELMRVSVH
jgi:hypothetical protein